MKLQFLFITIILFILIFIIDQIIYISPKEKIINFLDETSYIKVNRLTTLFDCDKEFETTIKDEEMIDSFKKYALISVDNITNDNVQKAAVLFPNLKYVVSFYNSDNILLFKLHYDKIQIKNTVYNTLSSKEYESLIQDKIKDIDECYPVYQEYIESLKSN